MRAVLALALLATACRVNLDHAPPDAPNATGRTCAASTSLVCTAADQHADLTWLQANVFFHSCGNFTQCHDGKTLNVPLDMSSAAQTYSHLVTNAMSDVDGTRMLVVPGNVAQSYLAVVMRVIEPAQADPPATSPQVQKEKNGNVMGYMPQNGSELCCQKLDAVARWIEAGAPSN